MFSLYCRGFSGPSLLVPTHVASSPAPSSSSYLNGGSNVQTWGRVSLCQTPPLVCQIQEATKPDNLSAKERRKQRNERREELKDLKGSWRDEVETKLDVKKKAPKGWEEILDINQLTTKGMQWWMIAVPKNGEQKVADHIELVFQDLFPNTKLQILLPSVPRRKILKDGRYSDARQRLYPGCLLVRCVLNREVYNFIRNIPGVWDFFGTRANTSVSDMIIPAAVSSIEIHEMFKRIEMEDTAFKEIREAANREADERERQEKVAKSAAKLDVKMPSLPQLEEGATVQVNSGPFTNHMGVVDKINHEEETLKIILTIFGRQTVAKLGIDNVTVI